VRNKLMPRRLGRNSIVAAGAIMLALLALALPGGAAAADRDGDGIDDALEDALLARFAPVVLLHPTEPIHPSSTKWLLARADLEPEGSAPRTVQASVLGALATLAWPQARSPSARLRPHDEALHGSANPGDWAVYGHAYPAADGGMLLQYWFFYPFNDGYGFFDHAGDWEHVTVKLAPTLRPAGVWYARHFDSNPGAWFAWDALVREGEHPVVLAGRGTHASYAFPDDAPFWERLCGTIDLVRAADQGCTVWRTWKAGAGVVNVGERDAPRTAFIAWPGRWGATGWFGEDSHTAAPPGPAFQPAWCSGAAPGRCR
jgi:VPS62-like protein